MTSQTWSTAQLCSLTQCSKCERDKSRQNIPGRSSSLLPSGGGTEGVPASPLPLPSAAKLSSGCLMCLQQLLRHIPSLPGDQERISEENNCTEANNFTDMDFRKFARMHIAGTALLISSELEARECMWPALTPNQLVLILSDLCRGFWRFGSSARFSTSLGNGIRTSSSEGETSLTGTGIKAEATMLCEGMLGRKLSACFLQTGYSKP